jgi:tetratricopeptide (TPR) repeat protein
MIAWEAGNLDLAIASLTRCINEGKLTIANLAAAYYNRGNAYEHRSQYDQAIKDYEEVIYLDPNNVPAHLNRGNSHQGKGDYDLAIRDYDEVIRKDSKFVPAYYNRGNAYQRKGEHDQAISDYDTVISLEPGYAPAYLNRGNAYQGKEQYDLAVEDYNMAIRLNPSYAHAYYNRGLAYLNKGDQEQALRDYNEAIRLNAAYAEAPYAQPLTTEEPQVKSSTVGSPPTTQEIEKTPAGLSEADRKSFAIHLASVRSKEGADIEWKTFQDNFPDLLRQRELIIRSIDVEGQGTFFRVMTGPFQDLTQAQHLCAEFKAFEQYCMVIRLTDAR